MMRASGTNVTSAVYYSETIHHSSLIGWESL